MIPSTLPDGVGRVASLTRKRIGPSQASSQAVKLCVPSLPWRTSLRRAASSRTLTVFDSTMPARRSGSILTGTLLVSQGTSMYTAASSVVGMDLMPPGRPVAPRQRMPASRALGYSPQARAMSSAGWAVGTPVACSSCIRQVLHSETSRSGWTAATRSKSGCPVRIERS